MAKSHEEQQAEYLERVRMQTEKAAEQAKVAEKIANEGK